MLCFLRKNKYLTSIVLFLVGITSVFVSLALGVGGTTDSHTLDMLSGMFMGFGGALVACAIVSFVYTRFISPERARRDEINAKDERNKMIIGAAAFVAYFAAAAAFVIMAFLFIGLGYIVPGIVSIIALYIEVFTLMIAKRYYQKKM